MGSSRRLQLQTQVVLLQATPTLVMGNSPGAPRVCVCQCVCVSVCVCVLPKPYLNPRSPRTWGPKARLASTT